MNKAGGSPKGRDVRRCPKSVKAFAHKWAIDNIGKGNESIFMHDPLRRPRFTKRLYVPLVSLIKEKFPLEYEAYFGGREEKAPNLIMHRVHKMYYHNDGKSRGRGKSNENPSHWNE